MLCHSTHPRGGVAHALALAEALVRRGHQVAVHAPDPGAVGFPRSAGCTQVSVAADAAPPGGLAELVAQRIGEYRRHFAGDGWRDWDILHAHDGIGANALLALREEGCELPLVHTVHHLDEFQDSRLVAWQQAGVTGMDLLCCVSQQWKKLLAVHHGIEAILIGNGVDLRRYSPRRTAADAAVRLRWQLDGPGPLVLAIGGVEERKNPLRLLEAFLALRIAHPAARLLMVGGASLLDHSAIQREFLDRLAAAGLTPDPAGPVTLTGPLPDQYLPALLRAADLLAFPSLREGFGLVVLEAMACGTPVVTSRIEPFTEYLGDEHASLADPHSGPSIAAAMMATLVPARAEQLRAAGLALAARMDWDRCAARQEAAYLAVRALSARHPRTLKRKQETGHA